jgi:hypothetical protein
MVPLSSFILITVFTSLISAYSIGGRWLFIYTSVSHAKAMNAVWQEDCNCGWGETAQSIYCLFLTYYPSLFQEGLRRPENHPL